VRKLRRAMGMSQEELAERADLHRTYIAGIEGGGRNITLRSVDKLAKALKVSVPVLLSEAFGENVAAPSRNRSDIVDILLVEDNPGDIEMTLDAFSQARIINPVHVVRDGEQALNFLFGRGDYEKRKNDRLPQVILLDLKLPRVSGIDVLRQIKSDPRTKNISVVVLTGSNRSVDMEECKRLGVESYIVKPVRFDKFSEVASRMSFLWALVKPEPAGSAA
jgi:two-component system, response regulator